MFPVRKEVEEFKLTGKKCDKKKTPSSKVICVTEQHYVSIFFPRLWYATAMLFRYINNLRARRELTLDNIVVLVILENSAKPPKLALAKIKIP